MLDLRIIDYNVYQCIQYMYIYDDNYDDNHNDYDDGDDDDDDDDDGGGGVFV